VYVREVQVPLEFSAARWAACDNIALFLRVLVMAIATGRTMPPLLKHLAQKPPLVLYHYTSLKVLEKITRNGEIWASDIEFLNDSDEYVHAKEFIKHELETRVAKNEKLRSIVHSYVGQIYHELDHLDLYVASFSTDGDSLPQWRGYCPNGQGVAIGFLPGALTSGGLDLAEGENQSIDRKLLKCVYTSKEKIKLLDAHLNHFLKLVTEHFGTDSLEPGRFLGDLTEACCPFFKNESFREEMEWRLSVRCMYRDVPRREFHIGRSTVVPHLRIDLRKNHRLDFIKELVIGPTPNKGLAFMGVKTLLNRRDLSSVAVRNSNIPYRMW
jgi:hypothetical protein